MAPALSPAAANDRSSSSSSADHAGPGSLISSPSAQARHELKGLRLSGHEKSAIVKADRDPTIFAALDYFADLTLQRYLGSPCESFSDQPDSIANLESALGHGNLLSFRLEPELDQAADGFRAAGQILLLAAPVVEQLRHVGLNANHYRISGDCRALLAWFRGITS
jgi:hypothetical protein